MTGPIYTTHELLARLVSFDTTSHKTNLPLVRFVEDYLLQHGVVSQLVVNGDGDKANLFATIGEKKDGGIALSGHTDVVPTVGQDWDSDPYVMTEKDGRLYGRGTADMKGFLACVLERVPGLLKRQLGRPLHIAFSYDEEVGCTGVRPMIEAFGSELPTPGMVIVGEPTSMQVVDAHKGPVRWEVAITGRAAHSSMSHLGVNAITYASKLLDEISQIEKSLIDARIDDRFEPPHATMQVTEIEGGTASNIVPVSCRFGLDLRALPGMDADAVEERLRSFAANACVPEMRGVAPEADIAIKRTNAVPPFTAQANSDVVALALSLTGSNETFAVSYATEAGLFQDAGTSAVVCGPGDIAQAHTANEWIDVAQLEQCSQFLDRLADWMEG